MGWDGAAALGSGPFSGTRPAGHVDPAQPSLPDVPSTSGSFLVSPGHDLGWVWLLLLLASRGEAAQGEREVEVHVGTQS